jgi:hypothetical protein
LAEPISRKLIVRPDGRMFIVTGNPTVGYDCHEIVEAVDLGHYRRSWQAVAAAHGADNA